MSNDPFQSIDSAQLSTITGGAGDDTTVTGLTRAATGAGIGATIGSVGGPPGALVGAGIGALAGWASRLFW